MDISSDGVFERLNLRLKSSIREGMEFEALREGRTITNYLVWLHTKHFSDRTGGRVEDWHTVSSAECQAICSKSVGKVDFEIDDSGLNPRTVRVHVTEADRNSIVIDRAPLAGLNRIAREKSSSKPTRCDLGRLAFGYDQDVDQVRLTVEPGPNPRIYSIELEQFVTAIQALDSRVQAL